MKCSKKKTTRFTYQVKSICTEKSKSGAEIRNSDFGGMDGKIGEYRTMVMRKGKVAW